MDNDSAPVSRVRYLIGQIQNLPESNAAREICQAHLKVFACPKVIDCLFVLAFSGERLSEEEECDLNEQLKNYHPDTQDTSTKH
jgi:hypothetical protein